MKKQLLNESEIRKMMKFANIGALTDGFVDRLDEAAEATPLEEEEGPEELEEQADPMADVMPVDDEDVDPVGDEDVEDLGDEEDLGDMGEPGGEMELSEEEAEVLIALGDRLAAAQGDMEDLGDEEDLGGEEDLGDMGDMGDMGPEPEEDVVNEVVRRVSKRLLAMKR